MKSYDWPGLLDAIEHSGKQYNVEVIHDAYLVAEKAHDGQKRKSGEPYIIHPVAVAGILVEELGMDTESVTAALLHDVVEDTDVSLDDLRKRFGAEVALLVDGVTKLGKIPLSSREQQQAENVRKMLLAMAQDVRVVIIKLADRLHNMRTLQYVPEQKQRDTARETMEVYAPLAHRLGIRAVKDELEDKSLRFLDPISYKDLEDQLMLNKSERESILEDIKTRILHRLEKEYASTGQKVPYLEGRVKSIYGIYRKVCMQNKSFESIYDIYAVRIIVDTLEDCYRVLGIMHDMFRPLPDRFKDYISTPKANMYQSLHTTVLDEKGGIPFEIQIRTWEMHYTAEYGIAAHWKYKAGISGKDRLEERLAWVRQMLENQKETGDVEDIVHSIKTDLVPDEVFVYTPKGDLISLPVGATVIDFAYAIHTQVGHRMIGARVDGRMVSLDYQVQMGNIIEVILGPKDKGPNRDWLNIVKTNSAKTRIRAWFKRERREENIAEGKQTVEREFKRNQIVLPDDQMQAFLSEIAQRQKLNNVDEFYAAIGYGGISLSRIMPRIKDDFLKTYREPASTPEKVAKTQQPISRDHKKSKSGVIVEGLDNCQVKFARCCNPVPGDEIIGFITRGYGVSIHKKDCPNVKNAMNDESQRARWVNTYWSETVREAFDATVDIQAHDRTGLLADVTICLSNLRLPIRSVNAREAKDDMVQIQITVGVNDLEQLNLMIAAVRRITSVVSVNRTAQS